MKLPQGDAPVHQVPIAPVEPRVPNQGPSALVPVPVKIMKRPPSQPEKQAGNLKSQPNIKKLNFVMQGDPKAPNPGPERHCVDHRLRHNSPQHFVNNILEIISIGKS